MKLYAISDLHLNHPINREALLQLPSFRDDWLVLAGDVADTRDVLETALQLLTKRFARIIWVPGNHDLWTDRDGLGGVEKYNHLVSLCREYGVDTPEDPYPVWPAATQRTVLAPLFTLYDYSFHPEEISDDQAVAWAAAAGIVCADEHYLRPDPYASRIDWCVDRCKNSEKRLEAECDGQTKTVLINHWPLLRQLARLPLIPRFMVWCGTTRTEQWARRFNASVMIHGHLHIRSSRTIGPVRVEEVSLGYPRQWAQQRGVSSYLRQILPES